jgi:hypothetical protein
MTIHAFTDAHDGYYQVDVPDGQPMPAWTQSLTPCAVQAAVVVPAAPLSLTPFQMRAALTQAGLRAQAEAFVTASTNQSIKDAWQFAQSFVENDAFITAAATALSQTTAQVHSLFQLGQTLAP